MMAAGAVDVVQPSVTKIGISGVLAVQALAARHGVAVVPHCPYFGPGLLASLHLLAAAPVEEPLEVYFADLAAPPYPGLIPRQGFVAVPEGPGLGMALDEVALGLSELRHAASSWPALAAGLLAGFVGFASSFAVVLQGLRRHGGGCGAGGLRADGAVHRHGALRDRAQCLAADADQRRLVDAGGGAAGVLGHAGGRLSGGGRRLPDLRRCCWWWRGCGSRWAGRSPPSRRRWPMPCWRGCCSGCASRRCGRWRRRRRWGWRSSWPGRWSGG